MPNPAFGGNLGQKINCSRVNLTSSLRHDLPEYVSALAFHLWPTICPNAVPAPKYFPERRSTAFPHHHTPAQWIQRQGCKSCVKVTVRVRASKVEQSVRLG